jgi:anti-sigma factor RsiW
MNCTELERLLPVYADGEFDPGECAETELHLHDCRSCRQKVEELLAFRALVRSAAVVTPAPAALRDRVQRTIARQRSVDNLRRFAAYSAVAAGLAMVATAGYVAKDGRQPPGTFELVVDAVDKHARALPLEVTPAAGDVESWFRGKVDFNVRAPVFDAPGAPRLQGARLANVGDREAAYFVYGEESSPRRMTLLLFPGQDLDIPEAENRVLVANEKGYNVALWRKQGIVYSLVSDLDERDVRQLVAQVAGR